MLIVFVKPNNETAEAVVRSKAQLLRKDFGLVVREIWGVPITDMIVRVVRCECIDDDSNAASVDIWVETNPDAKHEGKANELRDALVRSWDYVTSSNMPIEVWVRFIRGSWCHAKKIWINRDYLINDNNVDM